MHVVIPVGYNKEFPVTKKPQTFLELAGKQVFSTILEKLKDHEVIVVTPFPKYFKNYDVQVLKDEFDGSAASLRAIEKLIEGPFVVHFSDIFTPFRIEPLIEFHEQHKPMMTLATYSCGKPSRYGVLSTDPAGKVVRFLHNPRPDLVFSNLVSTGIMVLEPEVFDKIPYKMDMPELVNYLVQRKMPVYGFEFKTFWYHLGSVPEYVEANQDYLKRRMEMTQEDVKSVNIYPPVSLSSIRGNSSFVGPYVSAYDARVGKGSKIRNSVVYPGAVVGDDVNVSDSVIGPKARIASGAIVTESLLGEGSRVGPNVKVGRSIIGIDKEVMENVFELSLL